MSSNLVEHRVVSTEVMRLHQNRMDFEEGDLLHRLDRFNHYVRTLVALDVLELEEFSIDDEKVEAYKQLYLTSNTCPPIVYDSVGQSIIDGSHRANALAQLGVSHVEAYVGIKKHMDPYWSPYDGTEYCD